MALSDLLPTPPWKGPPLPAFLARNPGTWKAWTSPEEYTKVAEKAGDWAAARSASMLSRADTMAGKLDDMAEKMYLRMLSHLSITPTPIAVAERVTRKRVPRAKVPEEKEFVPPVIKKKPPEEVPEEVAPPTKKLKRARTENVEWLAEIISNWRREEKVFPTVTDIRSIAEDRGFTITDAQLKKIVGTLQEEKPIILEELKEPVIAWIKVAKEKPGEWPDITEIESYARIEYHDYRLPDEVAGKWLEEAKVGG